MSLKGWVLRWLGGEQRAGQPLLSEQDILDRGRALAREKQLPWREPVKVDFDAKARQWHLRTNAAALGSQLRIVVDDQTGEVRHSTFLPR